MKWHCAVCFVFFSLKCFSQVFIEPYPLQVGLGKTTNLIFPYEIKSVDRGSKDVLVQKAKGIENVLQVKANIQSFLPTTLSVIAVVSCLHDVAFKYSSPGEEKNATANQTTADGP